MNGRCSAFYRLKRFYDNGNTNLKLKRKFENFIYHKIKILTGGAYAPYAPCMGTPLVTQGPKIRHLSFFLLNHILRCICFKILFQNENVLFLTEVILV